MKKTLRPYLFISICGVLAFAPVSFMLRAMKNDVIALEYPINQFISQSIRHGEIPYWFNTWGMGFPLQSNLTWSMYSTPQVLFSAIGDYNIYTLHLEFLFYILLAGWGMFYLLKRFFLGDESTAKLLAVCYMLSGFMVGSTQWMLYVTAAAFVPLLLISLLHLLERPSLKNSLLIAVTYTVMFTSVYAAFNIITTYGIIVFLAVWLWNHRREKKENSRRIKYLLTAGLTTALLCFPCLYFTIELLNNLDRGNSVAGDQLFFNSNYLHPGALTSMLFPFSAVKMQYSNTEGTMLDSYAGLFILLLLPLAIQSLAGNKNRSAYLLAGAALLFLLTSFGDLTPVRKLLNILPGFSFFRNPAIFRFYFILCIVLFCAVCLKEISFSGLIQSKTFRYCVIIFGLISLSVFLFHISALKSLVHFSISNFIKDGSYSQAIFISSAVQCLLLAFILLFSKIKKALLLKWVFAADLVLNTLLCTPFFSVSSYTPAEVNTILQSAGGYPVQQENPSDVATEWKDTRGNAWKNVNVYSKKVSAAEAYWGPLILKNMYPGGMNFAAGKPLVYADGDTTSKQVSVLMQKPNHIRALAELNSPGSITLLQNYYPGWTVYVNNKKADFVRKGRPGLTVAVPAGKSTIDFLYERKTVWLYALLLHLFIITFLLYYCIGAIRKKKLKSSFPSSLR